MNDNHKVKVTGLLAYSDNCTGDQKNKFALYEFTKYKKETGIPILYFQRPSYHNKWEFDQAGGNFKTAYIHAARDLVILNGVRKPLYPDLQPVGGIIDGRLLENI